MMLDNYGSKQSKQMLIIFTTLYTQRVINNSLENYHLRNLDNFQLKSYFCKSKLGILEEKHGGNGLNNVGKFAARRESF